jgi:exonuclease III
VTHAKANLVEYAGLIEARREQLAWIASEQPDVLALQEFAGASDLCQRLSDLGFKYFVSTEPMDGRKKLYLAL